MDPPKETKAASPPDDPPGVLVLSFGWQLWPNIGLEQSNESIHWGKFVRQYGIPPSLTSNSTVKINKNEKIKAVHACNYCK